MSEWAARRFWSEVSVAPAEDGFAVFLDARPVRTPGKADLILPTEKLAQAVAAEWRAQPAMIVPATMPFSRSVNAAVDKVTPQRAEVVAMLAGYAESDLICHRADSPSGLVDRQSEAWDPLLDWCASELGAPLNPVAGVIPVPQPDASRRELAAALAVLNVFELTAAHDLVALSGSLVIALAVMHRHLEAEAGWTASRIDEDWQAEQWGRDDEAEAAAAARRAAFLHARDLFELVQLPPNPAQSG